VIKSLKSAIADSILTEEQVTAANRWRKEVRRSSPKKRRVAFLPLALTPEEEGGQGLKPSPKINGLYVAGDGSDGILYNSQGMMVDEPECHKCLDHGFVMAKPPISRASAGPWDGQLVVCRH